MTDDRDISAARAFAFGPFRLIPERQALLRGETPVRIGGRALDILTALVEQPGKLVGKRELIARVWPTTIVDEGSLKVNMAALRRALGDGGLGDTRYIATVTGRGYQFIAQVAMTALSDVGPASATETARRHNLPTGTTRIVGRADAIDAIRQELDQSRLVSIVGAGGIGKTTVALCVAEHVIGLFKDGVWLVDLAPLRDPTLAPNAIAAAIGLAAPSACMLGPLCEFLREREMLLVLDNCEHVIEAAALCAEQILLVAMGVKILVTSREPLLAKGERVRRLPGLETPPLCDHLKAQDALSYPAVQLFVERATDRLESFQLSDANAPTVAEICRRLDGLALAIEFAATRIDVFDVDGLLKQLDHRFRLLVGRRAGPERQRTLTAALEWSYGLLSTDEASLLRAVSVFAGGFDIDDASAVANSEASETAELLAQLAAKSLLATAVDAASVAYRLLETTRTYCFERLRANGEETEIGRRHADHVCMVLERAAREWAQCPAREWGATYAPVIADLRAALAWAGRDAERRSLRIRLTDAGTLLWNHLSLTDECRVHVSRALGELDAASLIGTATEMRLRMSYAGATMFTRGLLPDVIDSLRRALVIAERLMDTDHRLRCLRAIGGFELFSGDHDAGLRTLEKFISVAAAEDPSALPEGETHLGVAELWLGRLHAAQRRLDRLYAHDLQDINDTRFVRFLYARNVDVGNILTNVMWLTGRPDSAALTATATVEHALNAKHELSLSNAIAFALPVALWNGDCQQIGRYVAMLDRLVIQHGIVTWRPLVIFYRGALASVQRAKPDDGVDDLERAVAELHAIKHMVRMPFYLGVLATALAQSGRLVDAAATIQAAVDCAHAQNERWCLPEVLRIRASILAARDRFDDAEATLLESMEMAREMGALSWQLRSANDLAKLWSAVSKADDARRMLASVFNQFTEGFATQDLLTSAGLLASLAHAEDRAALTVGTPTLFNRA